ncbi:MAG: Fibronectin type protein [Chlorobi bacterium]|nr:Fibronectin type protein [Chlorobiota bacterium]
MRRVLVLLCAVAFSLPVAKLFAQGEAESKGDDKEVLRQSVDSRGSFPGGPLAKAPLATGYYIVDNDAPAVGPPWVPTWQFIDTTGSEAQFWHRVVSGPNQRNASFWTRPGSSGYEYFRNPNQVSTGPNNTIITDSTDNAFAGPIAIGFPFYFYGRKYDSFYVSTNGLVALTNRRYQYDESGRRVDYEPVFDDTRPKTGNPLTDPTPDDFGYSQVALGGSSRTSGILNPNNAKFTTANTGRPLIAALWDDTELSQFDPIGFRPDDFGKVYWRRDTLGNKLLIYYVNQTMIGVKNIPLLLRQNGVIQRDIRANYQVVLDRIDSTVQINYVQFSGVYKDAQSQVINVQSQAMYRANSTIGVCSYDGEFTNYLTDGEPPGTGAVYVNGSTATPHNSLAIRFKQWKNVVRVNSVSFQVPSRFTPGQYVDLPAGQLVDNYEILLGNSLLGVIRPVGIVQNVSDSIGPVNKTPQPIRFTVVFRIRDLINVTNPPVYQRTAVTDSLWSIRDNTNFPATARKNLDTIKFDPYITNANVPRQVGRFRAEVIALDQSPDGANFAQSWPFDDTTGIRMFGIRRLEAPFIDAFSEYDYSPEDGIIPSVQKWVSIGAQVVDGDARTFNPPPPRGTFGTRNLNSPVLLLDRKDNFQSFYLNDAPGALCGDTIISFPINLSQLVNRPVLLLSYERSGKQGSNGNYDRGFADNQRVGPENAVYTTSKDQLYQAADKMYVEFAEPSPNGIDNIVNIFDISSWRYAPFNDRGASINWGTSSPRWGVFGGGGGSGSDTTGKIIVDEFDAGKDFEFYRAFIPIPARWSKVAPGNKTFRFRIRLEVKSDRNPVGSPSDDDDQFYVDNVMLIEPVKPEVEVTAVRVDWPYTQAPASQARAIPISVKVGNNGTTAATTFGVAMYVTRDPNTQPPGRYNYYRYKSIISIPAGKDYVESFPSWNAQECGSDITPDTLNPITSTNYIIGARIMPQDFDSYNANDESYTKFKLTLGPAFAYDDGTNDVQSEAGLQGKGLNLVPPSNQDGAGANPFGPLGGSSSGTFAMQFRILTRDTVRGFQAFYAGANQAQDFVMYSIYKQPVGTNANNPPAGAPVSSTITMARRGEGIPDPFLAVAGRKFNFDQYVTYMLDTQYVAEPGLYFATVAQLGETGLELGGDASRMGQVTTINNPPLNGGPTGGIGNFSIPAHTEMRQNRFWYEVTTGSSGWNPMITLTNNPGYPHLSFDGKVTGFPTYTRGSWIPMIRPYFGIKASSECLVEPVELADFKLTTLPTALRLDWQTATEVNNHGFYVERRMKGSETTWSDIAFKAGAGTSNQARDYSHVDQNVAVNTTYQYRLRQEDRDGSVTYSDIKEGRINGGVITGEANQLSQNTPNPVSSSTRIAFSVLESGKVSLQINDAYGNVVRTFDVEAKAGEQNEVVWDGLDATGTRVANGAYIYKLNGNGFSLSRKMTVTR